MAVQPNTDVRIDCPFCFHPNTFTLKNIDGKIMWNCFRASCNAKGKISRDMSPEELKKFLNSKELSLQNKMKSDNKIKWSVPDYFTSVYSSNRALNYIKNNNCLDAMQKGMAKIMYDPRRDRVVFLIKEQNKVIKAIGRAITSDNYPKWYVYGKKSNPFVCGNTGMPFWWKIVQVRVPYPMLLQELHYWEHHYQKNTFPTLKNIIKC